MGHTHHSRLHRNQANRTGVRRPGLIHIMFYQITAFIFLFSNSACGKLEIPVENYYDYDLDFPLQDSVRVVQETNLYKMHYVKYLSINNADVTGLFTIPKMASKPVPVIIFLHGIGDYKDRDYMEQGHQFMVDSSYAVFRIDAANHGDRKVHDYEYDFVDGYRYRTRNMIAQTVFDLRRAVDFLKTRPEIDSNRIGFMGISLGGIQGATQVALSERIDRAVLAVPGAGWVNMIQRSLHFNQLDLVIDLLYEDPLGQNIFLGLVQSRFDRSDPAGIASLLREQDKVVVVQEAIGDCEVPNIATDLLVRSMGAVQLGPPTDPVFGLEEVEGPVRVPALTQIRVPEALEDYFPPDTNTIPEGNNGVHNSAVLQEATFAQIAHLFTTGEIIHPCTGPCDPQ